jgi:hypothetical protein
MSVMTDDTTTSGMPLTLDELVARGELSSLDRSFARSLARLAGEERNEVLVATALASRQIQQGDVCLDLRAITARALGVTSENPDDSRETLQRNSTFCRYRALRMCPLRESPGSSFRASRT